MKKTIENIIKFHLDKYIAKRKIKNSKSMYDVLDGLKIVNTPIKSKVLVFVIPSVDIFGGGITSIIRLGTYLESVHDFSVYYYSSDNQKKQLLVRLIKKIMPLSKANVLEANDDIYKDLNKFVCATYFYSIKAATNIPGYKLYLVQDYEPFFNPVGDNFYLAKLTYSLGFHIVTLGKWIKEKILNFSNTTECTNISSISFPFEPKEYPIIKKNYEYLKNSKILNIAVYSRATTPRRLPGMQQHLLDAMINYFEKLNIKIKPYYFGDTIKYSNGENLGRLTRFQIQKLYSKCDFGMCMSATNVSLVPYEMMSSGLPIIDFFDSSITTFFDKDSLYLYENDTKKLFDKIKHDIDNPNEIKAKHDKIVKSLSLLSWDKTGEEFFSILNSIS